MGEAPAATLKDIVPAEYHDRGYLKDLLSRPQDAGTFAEIFKKMDGLEKVVGAKQVNPVPGADAKDEDWTAFLEKHMRPAKEDDYEIKYEGADKADPELLKALRSAFFAAGANNVQARKFISTLMPVFAAKEKASVEALKKQDAEFDALVDKTFGADREKIIARSKAALDAHVPPAFRAKLATLDNDTLVALSGAINSIVVKYGLEDKINPGSGSGGASSSPEEKRAEARKLLASEPWGNPTHPEHEKTKARVQQLYKEIAG